MRRRLQGDCLTANNARNRAADDHTLSSDHTCHLALLTNNHLCALHVSLDFSVDLQDTSTNDLQSLPNDLEVVANDRFVGSLVSFCTKQSRSGSPAIGPAGLQRIWVGRWCTRKHAVPRDVVPVPISKERSMLTWWNCVCFEHNDDA